MPGNAQRGRPEQMPEQAQRVLERIKSVPTDKGALTRSDFAFSAGTPDQRTVIAEFQAERPYSIRHQDTFDLSLMARETFTTDGTADNTETFNLSNNLLESSTVGQSFALFEGNSRVKADSVDYDGNSFDYTDDGTDNTLTAFYAAGEQALVSIQKVAPNGSVEELFVGDIGQIHRRDQNDNPLTMDLDASPFQPIIPTDFSLEVAVNAPYTAAVTADPDGDGTEVTAPNALLDVPHRGAPNKVPELAAVVRQDMARK
ncbi:hypothetical protein [Halosimplex amylolyticum]|uniref:hypothetical protein n=1 Tax=Halosimplex amylolyticum TaxID=3396616 RepID=UPI003F5495DD